MTPNQYNTSEEVEPLLSPTQEQNKQQQNSSHELNCSKNKSVAVTESSPKVDQIKVEKHGLETFDMLQYVTKVSILVLHKQLIWFLKRSVQ